MAVGSGKAVGSEKAGEKTALLVDGSPVGLGPMIRLVQHYMISESSKQHNYSKIIIRGLELTLDRITSLWM